MTAFSEEFVLDPERDLWLQDHAPTLVTPALAMMNSLDLLASGAASLAPHLRLIALAQVQVRGWIAFPDGARRFRVEAERVSPEEARLRLLVWRDAPRAAMSRFDLLATAEARFAPAWPAAPEPLPPIVGGVTLHQLDAEPVYDFYAAGDTFHGPAYRRCRSVRWAGGEGVGVIDADPGQVPSRLLNPLLLDNAVQAIGGDNIDRLDPALPKGAVAYPSEVVRLSLFGPTPLAGRVECRMRYQGRSADDPRLIRFTLHLLHEGRLWAAMDLSEVVFQKAPPLGIAPADRFRARGPYDYVAGLRIAEAVGDASTVSQAALAAGDWMPGTVAALYRLAPTDLAGRLRQVAAKDHMARAWTLHPACVEVDLDSGTARSPARPYLSRRLRLSGEAERASAEDAGPDLLDLGSAAAFWRTADGEGNPAAQLIRQLCRMFVRQVRLARPDAVAGLAGRPALLVANHQVFLESILAEELLGPVLGAPAVFIARREHAGTGHWIGALSALRDAWPGGRPRQPLLSFERSDPMDMLRLLRAYREEILPQGRSLFCHVEGEVALSCRTPVAQVSANLIELAVECALPILPVRFTGGLPIEAAPGRLTFPVGFGRQDLVVGAPIAPESLAPLMLRERKAAVLAAINHLAPVRDEQPSPPNAALAGRVAEEMRRGRSEVGAVWQVALREAAGEDPVMAALAEGRLPPGWSGPLAAWGQRFLSWAADPG